jgi:hypothetical protein
MLPRGSGLIGEAVRPPDAGVARPGDVKCGATVAVTGPPAHARACDAPDLGVTWFATGPFGCLDMLAAERSAAAIVTDSGGVQKEAYILGVPCVTVRGETGSVEALETGSSTLAGADADRIVALLEPGPP